MSANDHKHHVPNEDDIPKIQAIREKTIELEALFDDVCPTGRDLSLAKTNLEQARMWAIAALVKPRPVEEPKIGGFYPPEPEQNQEEVGPQPEELPPPIPEPVAV